MTLMCDSEWYCKEKPHAGHFSGSKGWKTFKTMIKDKKKAFVSKDSHKNAI